MIRRQIWLRIKVSVASYGYEVLNRPVMSDDAFDALCREIKPEIETSPVYRHEHQKRVAIDMDKFFREEFCQDTGQWIWNHPHIDGIARTFSRLHGEKPWK